MNKIDFIAYLFGKIAVYRVNNPLSSFYKSKQFEKILSRVNDCPALYKFNQDGGRLRTVSRGIDTLQKALSVLKNLQ